MRACMYVPLELSGLCLLQGQKCGTRDKNAKLGLSCSDHTHTNCGTNKVQCDQMLE